MNTDMTCQINSTNSDGTEKLGQHLGQNLKGGEVIELISDLGGGKTTFVRGIAKGLESTDVVTSPTFKLSNIYKGRKQLCHFDFYRLNDAGLMEHELEDTLDDPDKVIVIEWGEVVARVLPKKRLTIHIVKSGDESRDFKFNYPEDLIYLLEGIC